MPRVGAWPSRRMNSPALRGWVGGATTAGLAVCAPERAGIRRLCGCGCARPLWLLGGGSGRCGCWRSVAPSAAEVAARFQARPAAGAVVPWEEPSAAAARWRSGGAVAGAAARLVVPPAAGLLRSCRRTRRMRLLCRGRRCLWLRLLRGRRRGWRTAAIVTPFLRGRGRRLPGRLLRGRRCGLRRLLLGCRCLAAVAAARPAPAVAGRGGVRPGAPRGAPAPPAPVARLGRVAAAHFEPAVSPEQRVEASEPGVVSVVFARVAARPEAVAWGGTGGLGFCAAAGGCPGLSGVSGAAACAMTNGPSSGAAESRKAALQSSAARCWSTAAN